MILLLYTFHCFHAPGHSALPAPTIDAVSATSSTSLTVDWTFPSSEYSIIGYRISYTPVFTNCSEIQPGMAVVDKGATMFSQYVLSGLEEGMEYDITIQARGDQAFGDQSESIIGVTLDSGILVIIEVITQ